MVEITVHFDPARLSPNKRMHWAKRLNISREAFQAAQLGWMQAGRPRFDRRVNIDIIVRRGSKMDPDNCIAGLKPCLDGFTGPGLLVPDDSAEWVHLGEVEIITAREYKGKETVTYFIGPALEERR